MKTLIMASSIIGLISVLSGCAVSSQPVSHPESFAVDSVPSLLAKETTLNHTQNYVYEPKSFQSLLPKNVHQQ